MGMPSTTRIVSKSALSPETNNVTFPSTAVFQEHIISGSRLSFIIEQLNPFGLVDKVSRNICDKYLCNFLEFPDAWILQDPQIFFNDRV